MKKSLFALAVTLPFVAPCCFAAKNKPQQIPQASINVRTHSNTLMTTAYILYGDNTINYLNQLAGKIDNGTLQVDRLVISFLNPQMDPSIKNTSDLNQLMEQSGLTTNANNQGANLQQAIATLKSKNVKVLFAVGGWAYSCLNSAKPDSVVQTPECTANFRLTSDIVSNISTAGLSTSKLTNYIQTPVAHTTQEYTDAWVYVAKTFGADGIDLDYEENWFAAESTYYNPIHSKASWGYNENGPYAIPYSVIKYASYIKSLKNSASAQNLFVTMAAPSAGAYNIHNEISGAMFWCPVSEGGNHACTSNGQNGKQPADLDVEGNLKGVLYDMVHYIDSDVNEGKNQYDYTKISTIFNGVLNTIDSINVMTYDLDDGYDGITSSWCIGDTHTSTNFPGGTYSSRDPHTDPPDVAFQSVECSLATYDVNGKSQMQNIMSMYKNQVFNAFTAPKPHLSFGLEVGFPNYPINLDPHLPGGGTDDITDPHYRWNDPFVAFNIPLKANVSQQQLNRWNSQNSNTTQKSDYYTGVADYHSNFLIVNDALLNVMQSQGADGVILWSLNNDDYKDYLAKDTSWDYQQFTQHNWVAFGTDYSKYNYGQTLLGILFDNAASPEDILNAVQTYNAKK